MSYENDYLRLPGIWGSKERPHDPRKATGYHECGHALCRLYAGLIPKIVSTVGYNGTNGYCSNEYYHGLDFEICWATEGPFYELIFMYGGIVAGAWYSGIYNWDSKIDLLMAQQVAEQFNISFDGQLAAWERTHIIIESLNDLLERSASDLWREKILPATYWEHLLFNI